MKKILALLLCVSMVSSHCVIPVYATDVSDESMQKQAEMSEEETIVETEKFAETEQQFFVEPESETEEEKESLELSTYVAVNPLYDDLVTEADILNEVADDKKVSFFEEPEYLTSEEEVVQKLRTGMEYRSEVITIHYMLNQDNMVIMSNKIL